MALCALSAAGVRRRFPIASAVVQLDQPVDVISLERGIIAGGTGLAPQVNPARTTGRRRWAGRLLTERPGETLTMR